MSKDSLVKLAAVLIVAIIFGGAIFYQSQRPVYEGAESKIEHQEKVIQVTEVADGKIVRNIKEGFEVKVPKDWTAVEKGLGDAKIVVQKFGPQQKLDTEFYDGVDLKIFTSDNPNDLSIEEYAKNNWSYKVEELIPVKFDNLKIIKTTEKIIYGETDANPTIVTDSQVNNFSFSYNKKVYIYSCTAAGINYPALAQVCENIVKESIKNYLQ